MNVFRLDLASGRRVLFKKIGPADPTGIAFTIGGEVPAFDVWTATETLKVPKAEI